MLRIAKHRQRNEEKRDENNQHHHRHFVSLQFYRSFFGVIRLRAFALVLLQLSRDCTVVGALDTPRAALVRTG